MKGAFQSEEEEVGFSAFEVLDASVEAGCFSSEVFAFPASSEALPSGTGVDFSWPEPLADFPLLFEAA